MLSYFDLRKGVRFIFEGQPFEVLEFEQVSKAQDVVTARVKIKNLITGQVLEKSFHQSQTFEEADIEEVDLKFIFTKRGKYHFVDINNPQNRLELEENKIGEGAKFLKPGIICKGLKFEGKIINVSLPTKVRLKVISTQPSMKTGREKPGTKPATLETGAVVKVPIFIEEGDVIEVNTETGEYCQRIKEE
jgi:elongation factor P